MHDHIYRNLPGNPNWEGSFYEKLTEHCVWDADEFWKLHFDLTQAAKISNQSDQIDRELALWVCMLQTKVFRLVCAHFNQNDVFKISNLASEEIYQFIERFEMAVIGVFSGEVLSESAFDLCNPLIKK